MGDCPRVPPQQATIFIKEENIKRDEGIFHPKRRSARRRIDKEHAPICAKRFAVHQPDRPLCGSLSHFQCEYLIKRLVLPIQKGDVDCTVLGGCGKA